MWRHNYVIGRTEYNVYIIEIYHSLGHFRCIPCNICVNSQIMLENMEENVSGFSEHSI